MRWGENRWGIRILNHVLQRASAKARHPYSRNSTLHHTSARKWARDSAATARLPGSSAEVKARQCP
eukprot:4283186-Pyramimonas_sp.AAC.1